MEPAVIVRLLIAVMLLGCGRPGSPQPASAQDTSARATPDDAAATAGPDDDARAADAAMDGQQDAGGVADEGDRRRRLLAALAALDVFGFKRESSQVAAEYTALRMSSMTPNAHGVGAFVEATFAFCSGCGEPVALPLDERKAQLGKLHSDNPNLVLDLEDLALTPERRGKVVYVRSYVDDGETRAAIHTLEASYVGDGMSVRLFAYPQGGFPTSERELAEAFGKDELLAAVRAIFVAAERVLWPRE
jgi:hypothetical protein